MIDEYRRFGIPTLRQWRQPCGDACLGRHSSGWFAGVSFIYNEFRGGPIRALVTIWLPALQVTRRAREMYGTVPRVTLAAAEPESWPRLPPVYHTPSP
jgi:hypothetical protein